MSDQERFPLLGHIYQYSDGSRRYQCSSCGRMDFVSLDALREHANQAPFACLEKQPA